MVSCILVDPKLSIVTAMQNVQSFRCLKVICSLNGIAHYLLIYQILNATHCSMSAVLYQSRGCGSWAAGRRGARGGGGARGRGSGGREGADGQRGGAEEGSGSRAARPRAAAARAAAGSGSAGGRRPRPTDLRSPAATPSPRRPTRWRLSMLYTRRGSTEMEGKMLLLI